MAFNEALQQYIKCYECLYFGECPNVDEKIKAELEKPAFELPKPTNPLNPYTPYKSKYFDDHRFDPPRELTGEDIIRAMERMENE